MDVNSGIKFVLFDIDGTLISTGGAGTRSMDIAFKEVFSISDAFNNISMAGKTDIQIMKEGLEKHSLSAGNNSISRLCESYIKHLAIEMQNSRKHLKPGISEKLKRLRDRKDVYLGLLTGNIERGAKIKLEALDIAGYFPLGAFGSDHEDRNMLLPVAVEKFRLLYRMDIAFDSCVVIGDTPRDVECAKIHGAYSVAVATGPYSYEALAASGADLVLENMLQMDNAF